MKNQLRRDTDDSWLKAVELKLKDWLHNGLQSILWLRLVRGALLLNRKRVGSIPTLIN